ncbi:uncharacterized protein DFL_003546 [Arthrobotrys flagrans]|uniref:Eukaryotic translation initiation factor 3 subunit L n=1 Tax=Arthrobotrys flagrans TaxID=97331 RepID=A0A437A258_ARTFL|nr:hypothetical protein DFL_003546 [Arthrobotrys flagrans]
MSMLAGQTQYQNGTHEDDDFDDEGILAASIVEAIQNDDEDPSQTLQTLQSREDDLQSRLQAAATPLEYQASLEARYASYDNYCSLFHYILNSNGPVELDLPTYYWAWDVIDEFIYQFNTFCAYRNRLAKKGQNQEEIASLRENQQIWGCYSVLNILYSLIQRSQMNEQLAAIKRGEDPNTVAGEYGSRPLYRMLGYFSIIGLLRVHCLLGDFTLALKTLDDIELNKKAVFARVMGAHFTTYYYVGFCYMMMGRYSDAIKAFSHILLYVTRTKNLHNKGGQFDSISKTMDQMYALLAICVALCPTRLDDTIHSTLREKYADQFQKLQRGGEESLAVFEELFQASAPKFISPIPPDFDNPANNIDPMQHHLQVFMFDVKNNMMAPILRSYLKLYTSMDLHKLASFLETDPDDLRTKLLIFKQKSRQCKWTEGGLLSGEVINTSDLDYALQKDLIHISEAKVGRKLVDWYLRNLTRSYA